MLERVLKIGRLYDFYGALLTDKQRYCMEMHYLHDLSLAEIADELKVSRQAVHDILRRGEQILAEYESKLGLVERYGQEQATISKVCKLLSSGQAGKEPEVRDALALLKSLLNREEEVRNGF